MPMPVGHSGSADTVRLGKLVEHLREAISDLPHPGIVRIQSDFSGEG